MSAGMSLALQAAQTYSQMQSEEQEGKFESAAMETNARAYRMAAVDAIKRGHESAGGVRRDAAQVRGKQTASYAGQGVDVSSGTASAIQDETTAVGEQDVVTVSNNAWREAWGLRSKADYLESQARMRRIESKFKKRQTLLTGGLQMLGTAASARARVPRATPEGQRLRDAYNG